MLRRGSYANIASTLALVVALGGTSYAAVAIPRNSIGSDQIIDSSITSKDVKNGSLKSADFKVGELPAGAQGAPGAAGAVGPAGPAGPAGVAGAPGPAGTARAFGRVSPGSPPSLSAVSKGFTGVIMSGTGVYCLSLPGFDASTSLIFTTVDWTRTANPEGNATALARPEVCPASHPVGVMTERINPANGAAAGADDVAFNVMVP
jgi:hypothetical protein